MSARISNRFAILGGALLVGAITGAFNTLPSDDSADVIELRYTSPDNPWAIKGDNVRAADGVEAAEPTLYFANCKAARAAGAAPMYWGRPGYRKELDRDGDGVACEPHFGL